MELIKIFKIKSEFCNTFVLEIINAMKKIYLLLAFLSLTTLSFSQDIITRTNNEIIECNILKVDSLKVFFKIDRNGKEIFTSLEMSKVKSISYENGSLTRNEKLLTMEKGPNRSYLFHQGDKKLSFEQMVDVVKSNDKAYKEIRKAKSNTTLTNVLGFAGGFMIGYPLGALIRGGEPNWALAGVGAGLVVVSIPIASSVKKHVQTAVDIYNSDIKATSYHWHNELHLGLTQNGVGLNLRF